MYAIDIIEALESGQETVENDTSESLLFYLYTVFSKSPNTVQQNQN
jgi:hypothetical protein